jgi:hypothetical protein
METLLEALYFYKIEVLTIDGNTVRVQNGYEVEVESNGMYKLKSDGYIVAPFADLNDLCRFMLS